MSKGCDHCLHPLWAGIRCGICGRWAEEKMEEPSEALKQTWADYQEALKRFGPPRREWQDLAATEIHDLPYYQETREMYRFARAVEAALKEKNK